MSTPNANLVLNTAFEGASFPPDSWALWGTAGTGETLTREIVEIDGEKCLHIKVEGMTSRFRGISQNEVQAGFKQQPGSMQPITVSFDAKAAVDGQACAVGLHFRSSAGAIISQAWKSATLTTEFQRFSGTFTTANGTAALNTMVGLQNQADVEVWIKRVKVETGDTATPWTPSPYDSGVTGYILAADSTDIGDVSDLEDAIDGANYREQLIYKSAASGTASMDGTTTWITSTADTQSAWTTKRPTYSSDYPVLFVATQRQTVAQSGGTVCTCTTPVKDDTTTVIDGGHITTGTIDASVATITNINASNISSGTLSADRIGAGSLAIGKLDSSTQSTISGAAKRTHVSIAATNVDYTATGTDTAATLTATLWVDGAKVESGVTYKWYCDGDLVSGATARNLTVTGTMGLAHVYSCACTY